ncbi:unnamed protein product [Paramecium octaurelia]|uniref:VWFA domain-containing protein n=1 Tax=Paramecium octaurelia TaxID=43137 RepID=A0A8S1XHH7_PAROT|nr:unnamed protein product [Paramecium octaurelia]
MKSSQESNESKQNMKNSFMLTKQNPQSQQISNSLQRFQTTTPVLYQGKFNDKNQNFGNYQHLPDPKYFQQLPQVTISQEKFDDDDQIEANLFQAKPNIYDLEKELIFEIKTLQKMIKLSNTQTQQLPGIISIKTKDQSNSQDLNRVGVDLICLIDKSTSMNGSKIETVKQSLKVLLTFLTDQDRLQLIIFNSQSQRLTPLKRTTEDNKLYFTQMIDSINSTGGTQISSATEIAFRQLKGRKYRNTVSSVFLLSDGQDNVATQQIQIQLQQLDEEFTMHTFGFGQDHDAAMMTSICNLKNGSFYFVQNISLLDEFFVDALGGLKSVVGEKLKMKVNLKHPEILNGLNISKTHGNKWINKGDYYEINLPVLIQGSRKDFVFELELPKLIAQIQDNERNALIMEALLQITDPLSKKELKKSATLILTFFNQDEQIYQNEEDIEVLEQYNRVLVAKAIDDARKSCQQQQFDMAQNQIDNAIVRLETNKQISSQAPSLIKDLQQAKQASMRGTFNSYGLGQMMQLSSNSYQQQGVNSVFSLDGQQQQQSARLQSYSNNLQQNMVQQIQLRKTQNENGN